ncbi:MAG: metal ABC transporter permease [Planctomycetota bacterium]|nr:metal ABC transporter permease [Planctomycetota bacterium]
MGLFWTELDTWTAFTAALAAMSCAVPGTFLVLRRQSMLGDALSHTVLPGIVAAFLAAYWLGIVGQNSEDDTILQFVFLGGAVAAGVLTAFLTETVQRFGRVENSAALGVVYTSLFALGLLLVRMYADDVHLDAECVLFGAVETVVLNTVGDSSVPTAAVLNGCVLFANLLLLGLCFKELRLSTFDPDLATSLGLNSTLVHYLLMAVTSVTLVAAFRSVGAILVITVLIAPPVAAFLLTERLHVMIGLALAIAGASAFIGHALALWTPVAVFGRLGFTTVDDSSTAGMTAIVCGLIFAAAFLFSPRRGVIVQSVRQTLLGFRILCEDCLGILYRREEAVSGSSSESGPFVNASVLGTLRGRLACWRLSRQGFVMAAENGWALTKAGRMHAEHLVRSHRLWESYMARYFALPDDHLHDAAHRVEHFLDVPMVDQLELELDQPGLDPHGRSIPGRPASESSKDEKNSDGGKEDAGPTE